MDIYLQKHIKSNSTPPHTRKGRKKHFLVYITTINQNKWIKYLQTTPKTQSACHVFSTCVSRALRQRLLHEHMNICVKKELNATLAASTLGFFFVLLLQINFSLAPTRRDSFVYIPLPPSLSIQALGHSLLFQPFCFFSYLFFLTYSTSSANPTHIFFIIIPHWTRRNFLFNYLFFTQSRVIVVLRVFLWGLSEVRSDEISNLLLSKSRGEDNHVGVVQDHKPSVLEDNTAL